MRLWRLSAFFVVLAAAGCRSQMDPSGPQPKTDPYDIGLGYPVSSACCSFSLEDLHPRPGGAATYATTVYVTAKGGFSGAVALSAGSETGAQLPPGIRFRFSPSAVRVAGGSTATSKLTATADYTVPFDRYQIKVVGASGTHNVEAEDGFQLNVYQPPDDSKPNIYVKGDPTIVIDDDPVRTISLRGVRDASDEYRLNVQDDPNHPVASSGLRIAVQPTVVSEGHPTATITVVGEGRGEADIHLAVIGTDRRGHRLSSPFQVEVPP